MGIQFQVGQVMLSSDLDMMKRSTWNMYFWWTWLNGSASHRWLEPSGSSDRFNVRLLTSTFTCDKIYWSVSLRQEFLGALVSKRKQQRIPALTTPRITQQLEKHRKSHKSERNFQNKNVLESSMSTFMIAQGMRSTIASISIYQLPPSTPNLLDVPLPWQWSGKWCYSEGCDFSRENCKYPW